MTVPETPVQPVVDLYHGIAVEDPYRWLEDSADPAVSAWTAEQNEHTRAFLDEVPFRARLYEEIHRLRANASPQYVGLRYTGGRLFALKRQPPLQQPILVTLLSANDTENEQVIVDPNVLDPSGGTSIDFYVPSHDGQVVAVCLSQGGSEDGTLYIYETDTGRRLEDEVPRVNYPTAGGSAAWNGDASGFYYTRYPAEGERPEEDLHFYQQVYFHQLGTLAWDDEYMIGAEFPRIAEILLETTADGTYLLANVKNGDGGEVAHYLRGPSGDWTQVTRFEDLAQDALIGVDGFFYLLSRMDAPNGKILRLPLDRPWLEEAVTVVVEQPGAINFFVSTASRLYIAEMDGGPSRLLIFDHQSSFLGEVPVEPVSAIYDIVRLDGDDILYISGSFVTPPAWYLFNAEWGSATPTALYFTYPTSFDDLEVVRDFAVSRDGTRVPLNIVLRRGTALDGSHPVLLTGYGGYGFSFLPFCNPVNRVWFDAGGVYAVANLRGGGEYGEAWHLAGNLANKQNVFDDFIACAEYLIQHGYTSAEKLCITGASNGGLLMGAAMTQRPDLFRAVAAKVGIFDALRAELDPNGVFNITEFGTVENPQHFEALYDYSPYHRVVDGTAYPAVLFTTGENDGRVNPAHSRKMTARMQAATSSGSPVLLRTSQNTGHGIGTPLEEQIQEDADVFAFLLSQVGAEPG